MYDAFTLYVVTPLQLYASHKTK